MSGVVILTLLAFILALVLSVVNLYLQKDDERISKITELLPGFNCGACSFPGCKGMAENCIKDLSLLDRCRALKQDKKDDIKRIVNNK